MLSEGFFSPTPPTIGDLVTVRGRRWIVGNVRGSMLPSSPLRPAPPQHVVELASVEDDGMGEELVAVWEIEPGAEVIRDHGLPEPTGLDDPSRLDAFLHAVRWGAIAAADPGSLQAPFRSGVVIEDYQLDPLVRAVQMPRANLLIADDVGLGKTIEAGLIVQEFIVRHRARRVLVVCPASLQVKWRDEMREKFGLEFRIVDSELMRDLRRRRGLRVNPWLHFPRLITSIDYLKRERPLRLFRETVADAPGGWPRRYDMLIVDEAHNVAPAGRKHYALDSDRTQAIRTVARHFEHRLFLSATPHNGFSESFTALLELVDDQRFAVGVEPDPKQRELVVVRRLKTELPPSWDGTRRFARRVPRHIPVPYTAEERQVHADLERYSELRRHGADSGAERTGTEFVLKLLKKRLFSSPPAFAGTLAKHRATLDDARRAQQAITEAAIRRYDSELDEIAVDDAHREERMGEAAGAASRAMRPLSFDERALLDRLRRWAVGHEGSPDTKALAFLDWVAAIVQPGGRWSNERVIVFTEYVTTLQWLRSLLVARGMGQAGRVEILVGGMDAEKREAVKAAFQTSPEEAPVRILLATDAASEGIDLQAHCWRLVHYEIPWNPSRLEQRNGRIDRYGQRGNDKGEVDVFHFVDATFRDEGPGDSKRADAGSGLAGDLEFLYRAALKLEAVHRDLLGKVMPVLAAQVQEAMLGKRRRLDTASAEGAGESVRRALKFERDLAAQVHRCHADVVRSREALQIGPESLELVVATALELAGQPALVPAALPGTGVAPAALRVFRMPPLHGSWAACREGIFHQHTHRERPITFDAPAAQGRDDVVLVHLGHRLVQMSLRLLRSELWAEGRSSKLHRAAARVVPDSVLEAPAVVLLARLVLVGGDGRRLHEEIVNAGGLLTPRGFRRLEPKLLDDVIDRSTAERIDESLGQRLLDLWPKHKTGLLAALDSRRDERSERVRTMLYSRREQEVGSARAILSELEAAIRRELGSDELQLSLFDHFEQQQFERNRASLRQRLEDLPQEVSREVEAIQGRFADPRPQVFPAALLYLVPRSVARSAAGAAR